jgi:serine/threonine-protein kinase
MKYIAAFVMSLLLAANGLVLATSSSRLPLRVASHFDAAGIANGFMPRSEYVMFMAVISLGIPVLLVLVTVMLPFLAPSRLRIPSRDYWIAPQRLAQTQATLATGGLVMSYIVAAFMVGVQLLVLQANARTPPRMDLAILYAMLALLVVAILFWQFLLWRRFQATQ